MTMKGRYWKPEPKLWDFVSILLLISAVASAAGFVLFVSQAFIGGADGDALWVRRIGGWLLALGGEGGTLFATLEIFRKQQSEQDTVTAWDWGGLVTSALATLSGLVLAYIPIMQFEQLSWIQMYGALLLLPVSVLDYYSTLMELGYRQSSFSKRWEAWNDSKHIWEMKEHRRAVGEQPSMQEEQPPAPMCKHCGATEDKAGKPWSSPRALRAHEAWCKRRAAALRATEGEGDG